MFEGGRTALFIIRDQIQARSIQPLSFLPLEHKCISININYAAELWARPCTRTGQDRTETVGMDFNHEFN